MNRIERRVAEELDQVQQYVLQVNQIIHKEVC